MKSLSNKANQDNLPIASLFNKILLLNDREAVNIDKRSQVALNKVDDIRKSMNIFAKREVTNTKNVEIQQKREKEEIFLKNLDMNQQKKYTLKKKLYEIISPNDKEDDRLEELMSQTYGPSFPNLISLRGSQSQSSIKKRNSSLSPPGIKNPKTSVKNQNNAYSGLNQDSQLFLFNNFKKNSPNNLIGTHLKIIPSSNNLNARLFSSLDYDGDETLKKSMSQVSQLSMLQIEKSRNNMKMSKISTTSSFTSQLLTHRNPTVRGPITSSLFNTNIKYSPVKVISSQKKLKNKTFPEEIKKLDLIRTQVIHLIKNSNVHKTYKIIPPIKGFYNSVGVLN
jgi:hypothetical protein